MALNTGHEGALSTVHANSPEDALRRIETLALMAGVGLPHEAIREQLGRGIDLVVHLARLGDGSRRVVEVGEVVRAAGSVGVRELYRSRAGVERGRWASPPDRCSPRSPAACSPSRPARRCSRRRGWRRGWRARRGRWRGRAERGTRPSADEQRRLGFLGGGVDPGRWSCWSPARARSRSPRPRGPRSPASLVARRRERYRRAVERSIPDVAAAIADAISGGSSVRAALGAAPASLQGPPARELARVARRPRARAPQQPRRSTALRRPLALRAGRRARSGPAQPAGGRRRRRRADAAARARRPAERDRVADDARAATTQARFTGLLVVALPAGAALFAELLEPGFVARVLSEPAATAMLLLAAGGLQLARVRGDPAARAARRSEYAVIARCCSCAAAAAGRRCRARAPRPRRPPDREAARRFGAPAGRRRA